MAEASLGGLFPHQRLSSAASASSCGPQRLSLGSGSPPLSLNLPPPPKVTQALRAYDETPTLDLPGRSRLDKQSLGSWNSGGLLCAATGYGPALSDGEDSLSSVERRREGLDLSQVIPIPGVDYVLVPKSKLGRSASAGRFVTDPQNAWCLRIVKRPSIDGRHGAHARRREAMVVSQCRPWVEGRRDLLDYAFGKCGPRLKACAASLGNANLGSVG